MTKFHIGDKVTKTGFLGDSITVCQEPEEGAIEIICKVIYANGTELELPYHISELKHFELQEGPAIPPLPRERRLKRLIVSELTVAEFLSIPARCPGYIYHATYPGLPADAKLERFRHDDWNGTFAIDFSSSEWPEVGDGQTPPKITQEGEDEDGGFKLMPIPHMLPIIRDGNVIGFRNSFKRSERYPLTKAIPVEEYDNNLEPMHVVSAKKDL